MHIETRAVALTGRLTFIAGRLAIIAGCCSLAITTAYDATAQERSGSPANAYPSRPVHIVVPFGPGNSVEIVTRIVADKLSAAMRQAFVIEAKPGASGAIGTEHVARSPADGYTLLSVTDGVMTILPSLQPDVPFDPTRDFVPITQIAGIPFALVAHPAFPAQSVKQLIELAKSQPGKFDYSTGGNGSAQHFVMEMFMSLTGTRFTHIPYKGAPQAAMDVVSGQVPIAFAGVPIVKEHIASGRLRGMAIASDHRLALLPDVPTLKEEGIPLRFATWAGLFAPSGTPSEITNRINEEVLRALQMPDVRTKIAGFGFEIYGVPSEQFARIVQADLARFAELVRKSGIKAN
jgi:tripartite-type tricarboxylate transporter receptor subunit TctC